MRGKPKDKSPRSKSDRAITKVGPEDPVPLGGEESNEDHDEDKHEFEETMGDEASDSDDEEGEEHNEESTEDKANVNKMAKRKPKKNKKGGTKRKNSANVTVIVGANSKRKKVPIEAQKSMVSNTCDRAL